MNSFPVTCMYLTVSTWDEWSSLVVEPKTQSCLISLCKLNYITNIINMVTVSVGTAKVNGLIHENDTLECSSIFWADS